ncbi:hypothetical protein CCHL11_00280 [Colletotrichum chlorophyti]|uniref:Uncharacterized protein n=1 Tax=Colletotrichum chlorophyti TaxID=708187 RepID=A0A1Q8RUZ5_9PEZI|nr:hypothetical protein CCHL11_00280 [Colletotrichum chlorophyti]
MRFFILSVVMAIAPFAVAEPIPADFSASPNDIFEVRNMLVNPLKDATPSCCSTHFVAPCDCGSCPILQCAYGGKQCKC